MWRGPEYVRVGDTILNGFDSYARVEKIIKMEDGYSFLYDIVDEATYNYSCMQCSNDSSVYVSRPSLKETLKLL
jgi:hypothetical protein